MAQAERADWWFVYLARCADGSLYTGTVAVEAEHRLDEQPRQRRQQRPVVAETLAPREWHREHPLTERHAHRQHVLHQMRSRRRHLPPQARRTESPALAAERHQPRLLAPVTPKTREPSAEQAAVEIALEFLPHELRQRDREGTVVHRAVERGEVVLHHLIERRLLRSATLVDDRRRQHVAPTASRGPKCGRCDLAVLRSPPLPDGNILHVGVFHSALQLVRSIFG
jgi:hypothetical protein